MFRSSFRQVYLAAAILGCMGLALIFRLPVAYTMYDIHIDEITYDRFSQTVSNFQLPLLYSGEAFFLHPPGYFVLGAIWRLTIVHGGGLLQELMQMRILNVALAAITAGVIFWVARYITRSAWFGVIASAVYSLDPLTIRLNIRGFIETSAMLWLLVAFYFYLRFLSRPTKLFQWFCLGLLFGIAFVTKDVTIVFMTLVSAVFAYYRIGPKLKELIALGLGSVIPYSLWVFVASINGYFYPFIMEKTIGLQRFIGLVQVTGYNSPEGPSKFEAIVAVLELYGPSFALIGLTFVGGLVLWRSRVLRRRQWGYISVVSVMLLVYEFALGTMEEQYLYYVLVPGVITLVATIQELFMKVDPGKPRLAYSLFAAYSLAAICSLNVVLWQAAQRDPDVGWSTTAQWVRDNIPAGARVAVYAQGDFIFRDFGYDLRRVVSAEEIAKMKIDYLILPARLVAEGYTPISLREASRAYQMADSIFMYDSRDSGVFEVLKFSYLDSELPKPDREIMNKLSVPNSPLLVSSDGLLFLTYFAGSASIGTVLVFRYINWRQKQLH